LALSAIDDAGEHIFSLDDVDAIMKNMSYDVLNRLTTITLEISGLKDKEPEKN